MYRITVETERRDFELFEDDKTTSQFLETYKIAKKEGKHAVFSFFCQKIQRQVIIGVEQIQFISYKPMEGKGDQNHERTN
ncbi:hypothetical protein FKQ51_17730 [Bacillus toyonensis]|uniref:hypothetical protein n=1 Tax=Bacillus toyonensis TaxID=155322 RepID=UPI002709400B|nr:hypothetical protein [Bacillus toyonensis]MDO8159165.1 hypothetical protein [Bacillus toyonensis]